MKKPGLNFLMAKPMYTSLLPLPLSIAIVAAPLLAAPAQQRVHAGRRAQYEYGQCPAVDASKSPVQILFEGVESKGGADEGRVEEVVLSLKNNSECTLILEAPPGQASQFTFEGGKLVRHDLGEIKNRQFVSLKLLMKYPKRERLVMLSFGGDVLDYVKLGRGNSALISVPLENFRRNGELHLPYRFNLESRSAAVIAAKRDSDQADYSAEHYATFGPQDLPRRLLEPRP